MSGNPPLEELFIQVNEGKDKISALNKFWASREIFVNYISLTTSEGTLKSGVDLDEWQHVSKCFCEDMKFLLHCQHHEFWSYIVHQKTALAAVVSFLQRVTPFYLDVWSSLPEELSSVKKIYEEALDLVLRIICRLITNRESETAWISKDYLQQLVYKNYLISVPMLLDLVVAVGDTDPQNVQLLKRIFETILEIEPKYRDDLLAALAFFRAAFRTIQTQAENEGFEGAGGGVADDTGETPYDDVALYTLDCGYTLALLLEISHDGCALCSDLKMGQSIAHFYDSTIPFLYKNICLIKDDAKSLNWLNQARLQFLKAFRCIANYYIASVLKKPEQSLVPTDDFIGLLTECLSEQVFVIDYGRAYPVDLDIEILRQACKDIDDFKASYVSEAYGKESNAEVHGTIGHKKNLPQLKRESSTNTESVVNSKVETNTESVSVKTETTVRDIDFEVTTVLDVFPDIGTGFIRRVLSRYDNSEEAISAILEENLPPDLANADRMEPFIPPDIQDELYRTTGVKHYNIHDGDAFDIMTQDQPKCIIKQGKGFPSGPNNAAELLDDKSDLKELRHRYQEYALVSENISDNDDYEDEYDDSYEALLESETRAIKSKQVKNGLTNVADTSDYSDADYSSDDNNNNTNASNSNSNNNNDNNRYNNNNSKNNFCENPEDVRARYEAHRQAKWERKSGSHNNSSNVVGAPKGQGQDKETLRNRNKKEVHKSSRANHNRKAGASYKRSKGMIP